MMKQQFIVAVPETDTIESMPDELIELFEFIGLQTPGSFIMPGTKADKGKKLVHFQTLAKAPTMDWFTGVLKAASVTDWEILAAQDWHVKKEVDEDGKETVVGGVYKKVPISIMGYLMDAEGNPVDKVVDLHTYSGADQFVWDVPKPVKADVEVAKVIK